MNESADVNELTSPALQNAASGAALMLMTSVVVTDMPGNKKGIAMPGGAGMEDMY